MTQNGEHKPTVNGVIKGRPGKGRVLSLGQRKTCYAQHRMTKENTFRYTPKPTKGTPKPLEREWCKRCRADSRKRGRVKRLAAAKTAARIQAKADKVKLAAATAKASGKAASGKRKASGSKAATVKALENVARKGDNASAGDLDTVLGKAKRPSRKAQRVGARKAA